MEFGSVCSGIEAASVAFAPLGWRAAWFSEIEPFPSSVLRHHYPSVRNHGDMSLLAPRISGGDIVAPDALFGGTPCQAFSLAGNRESLADDRGNLTLVFCEIADAIDERRAAQGKEPCVILWENVPGVLSTKDNAFGCFLARLAGEDVPLIPAGKRWTDAGVVHGPERSVAWRTLDAQYFGVAQRRKRVFVVASARSGFAPDRVLFEREGVRRDSAPCHGEEVQIAGTAAQRPEGAGMWWTGGEVSQTLDAVLHKSQTMPEKNRFPAVVQPIAFTFNDYARDPQIGVTPTLRSGGHSTASHANSGIKVAVAYPQPEWIVRFLTPREGERLQGFPDDYTLVPHNGKPAKDGPRRKAIGNSWAVPCVRWIGVRIQMELEGWL